jgi:AmiR/NasT family two-component response regulator
MVMVQLGLDGTSAFAALRARAFQEGRTLQEVAHDVLERRTRLDGDV